MFPAATAAPFARNVQCAVGFLVTFFLSFHVLLSFLNGLPRYPWRVVGVRAAESRRLKGALRFGPRSTTDASTFPPGPSRSDRVPHDSHVLIKVWHVFHVLPRLSTYETWTPGSFGARLCPTIWREGIPSRILLKEVNDELLLILQKSWWWPWGCPSLSRCVFFSLLMQPQVQVPVRLPGQQQQPWSTLTLNLTIIQP